MTTQELTYKEKVTILLNKWSAINSMTDWNNWAKDIRSIKFGTYGTISILEVITNTELTFLSAWQKTTFINEVKKALDCGCGEFCEI